MAGGLIPSDSDGEVRPMADINITPLVDVMLVLLIIFMVAAPMLTAGVQVNLPSSQAAQLTPPAPPLTLSIDAQGQIWLDQDRIALADLQPKLAVLAAQDPARPVYVRGDRQIAYGILAEAMGKVGAAGFTRVALITEPQP